MHDWALDAVHTADVALADPDYRLTGCRSVQTPVADQMPNTDFVMVPCWRKIHANAFDCAHIDRRKFSAHIRLRYARTSQWRRWAAIRIVEGYIMDCFRSFSATFIIWADHMNKIKRKNHFKLRSQLTLTLVIDNRTRCGSAKAHKPDTKMVVNATRSWRSCKALSSKSNIDDWRFSVNIVCTVNGEALKILNVLSIYWCRNYANMKDVQWWWSSTTINSLV